MPDVQMDPALRNAYLGEAYVMRALHYFNLVRFFGDVPLVTSSSLSLEEASNNPRNGKDEIYQLIVDDLEFAEDFLPLDYPAAEIGRATQGAAKSLLALVYLTCKEFQFARDKSQEVIGLGMYELLSDYRDVWDPDTKNSKEHIFSAQYQQFRVGAWFESILSPEGTTGCGFANNIVGVSQKWFDDYPDSYRKEISMMTSYTNTSNVTINFDRPYIKKYIAWGPQDLCFSGGHNYPILRYAEVLLILAEAENEVNGPTAIAYNAINQIRKRARTDGDGVEDVTALLDLTGLSKDQFRAAAYREREMELCFEGRGWFDLVRTDRLISENLADGKTNVSGKNLLYPFPQRALDLTKALVRIQVTEYCHSHSRRPAKIWLA